MEDNDAQPTNVLDMIAMTLLTCRNYRYIEKYDLCKAGEKIDGMKKYAAASLFGHQNQKNQQQNLKLK